MEEMKRSRGVIVLGDGEVTGHQHTVRAKSAKLFKIDFETLMLRLSRKASLRHEKNGTPAEHRTIVLPPGDPIVTHKRAYSPEGWTRVVD